MHKIFLSFLLLGLLVALPVYADPPGAPGYPAPPSPGPETCDWEEYKDSIKATESSGTYTAFNSCAKKNDAGVCIYDS
ncbi:hypothetical protein [Chryseobacterium cucumeris]|uniref:hypothetical protein n=1 Tax=Chryseobacterium cucumeris TaxID=1813611 RepID=UPI0023F3B14E|nr:hypothetical protein [Chryseobacterium cucumeris]